ncbi:hypothetical protein [Stutzerimonas stutzeri]|uniref:Lipoprotein n=1 Tax=Stutzerimonas stutzeri TaxID=316 RepID=A0AA40V948_STUST|nr:hypothetical protein [Stutzerimonas stutzeri]MBA1306628.1 hypothetical protein [Stutzerimonas stutzeri]
MPHLLRCLAAFSIMALAGCTDSSLNGAYEASIQVADETPQPVGLAVIMDDRIMADGQTVEVVEWTREGSTVTAIGDAGVRLAQFSITEQGLLVQTLPLSRVIYRKLDL